MPEYRLTRKAEEDLTNIAIYTLQAHGQDQAEKYKAALIQTANLITQMPSIGKVYVTARGAQFRKMRAKHHVMFYQATDYGILIARILHERMDVDRHL